jgi:hypothetical protein
MKPSGPARHQIRLEPKRASFHNPNSFHCGDGKSNGRKVRRYTKHDGDTACPDSNPVLAFRLCLHDLGPSASLARATIRGKRGTEIHQHTRTREDRRADASQWRTRFPHPGSAQFISAHSQNQPSEPTLERHLFATTPRSWRSSSQAATATESSQARC